MISTRILKYLILTTVIYLFNYTISYSQELDSLLAELEETMTKRAEYDITKETRINNLKNLLEDSLTTKENHYYITNKLIDEYQYYSFDAALLFIEKNIELAEKLENDLLKNEAKLRLAMLLVESGRYKEAIDIINQLNGKELPEELLNSYYFIYKDGYTELSYYTSVKKNKELYTELYISYHDSLLQRLHPDSEDYRRLKEKKYRDNRELDKTLDLNTIRLKGLETGSRLYSLITFERSLLYSLQGNLNDQKKYLALSAISDIQASVKDNASLSELAMILFQEGDIDRAHKFISFSVEDAEFYNSSLRFINISNILPVINKAFEERTQLQKRKLTYFLVIISILGLILLVSVFYIKKQVKNLSLARNQLKSTNKELENLNKELYIKNQDLKRIYHELSESDKIKEHYIGTFLNLYSEYIDKLDVYRKMVRKYITTNKTSDLLELTKSKKVIDTELKLFYNNFDESFLHIYPNFIASVNALLKPNEQIIVGEGEIFNTELRILALIRLSITNSSKISKILRYSINTIYNYRVKLRNGAINRDEFEDLVKKIN